MLFVFKGILISFQTSIGVVYVAYILDLKHQFAIYYKHFFTLKDVFVL